MTRRRARASLAAALPLAVLLALAGCASDSGSGADDAATASDGASASDEASPSVTEDAALPETSAMTVEAGAAGRGLPDGVEAPADGATGAAWTAEPGLLYVMTFGSSTCARVAEDATAADGTVTVTFAELPETQPCTMDYVPTTSVVAVPDDVDAAAPVSVVLGDAGTVDVAPRDADGETGPAAWVTDAG